LSALDDILIDVGNAAGSGNRIYTCPVALTEARNELAALRRERDALRGLVAGCAPYVHKAEHVIGCQARYGEKTCACGLFGLRDRIDAALRGEGGK